MSTLATAKGYRMLLREIQHTLDYGNFPTFQFLESLSIIRKRVKLIADTNELPRY